MDRIPIYARAGAVIPMWPEAPPSTAGHHPAEIELHVFVPRPTASRRRCCTRTTGSRRDGGLLPHDVHAHPGGDAVHAAREVEGDGYPEFARERFVVVCEGTRRTVEDREFEVTL